MEKTHALSKLFKNLTGHNKLTVDNTVVSDFTLNRFLGTWYEVARFNHRFERGIEKSKAHYELRKDGKVNVLNSGIKRDKPSDAKGIAKLTDTPALLRVSFWGPFYSDYRIMMLDKDYKYALIGGSTNDYLWILSRSPQISEDVRNKILTEAQRRGYDTSKLIWVKQ